MTDIEALCERLEGIATTDHERGCEGRNYACSCGWDEENMEIGRQASATIKSLIASAREAVAEIEGMKAMLDRLDQVVGAHMAGDCGDDLLFATRQRARAYLARAAQIDGEG